MHLIALLLSSCLVDAANGGWLRELVSPGGWHVGDGLVLHLLDSRVTNGTFLERHSMVMNYGGHSVSVAKARSKRAVELGFYPELGEARRQRRTSLLSILIGYKLAAVVTLVISAVGIFILKALSVAKIAVVASGVLLLAKLFHQHKEHYQSPAYVEIEHTLPVELGSEFDYHPSAASNYYSHAHFLPENTGNTTFSNQQAPGVSRRRDASKKRKTEPLITIHQFSANS